MGSSHRLDRYRCRIGRRLLTGMELQLNAGDKDLIARGNSEKQMGV
jgi:hypothetical protein